MNRVENGGFARLIRTIGYLLVFASAVLLSLESFKVLNVIFINDLVKPVNDFVDKSIGSFITGNVYMFLSIGLLLLLWTQTRSWFIRLFVTIIGVGTLVGIHNSGMEIFTFWKDPNVKFLTDIFTANKWINTILIVLSLFPIYLVVAHRRPTALSATVTSSGILLTLIAVVGMFLKINLSGQFFQTPFYTGFVNWTFALSYFVTVIGGLIGVLAIFRK